LFDFSITVFLKEWIHVWYLLSSALGTIGGGCCNYTLGRFWVFQVVPDNRLKMLFRYICFWGINFGLNVLSVFILTDYIHLNYMISKVLVAIVFGVFVNYFLQKIFVFKVNSVS